MTLSEFNDRFFRPLAALLLLLLPPLALPLLLPMLVVVVVLMVIVWRKRVCHLFKGTHKRMQCLCVMRCTFG